MKRKLMVFCALAFMLVSCAYNLGYVNTTYDLLAVSKASYEMAIRTAIDLEKQGRITAEEKARIFAIGRDFATAHNAAVEALAQYEEYSFLAGQDELEKNIEIAAQALSNLLKIVKPYLPED